MRKFFTRPPTAVGSTDDKLETDSLSMKLYKLGHNISATKIKPLLETHESDYIYVLTNGRLKFTPRKLETHATFTKLLNYNVFGYAAYAKVDNETLPLNRTLYRCKLVKKKNLSTRGTIVLVKKNVFAPIGPEE